MKSKEEAYLRKIKEEGMKLLNDILKRLEMLSKAAINLQKMACGGTFLLFGDCWEHFESCDTCPMRPIMDACIEIAPRIDRLLEDVKKLIKE